MSSMMCAWAFVVCLFVFVHLLFLSVVYLFSSSLYLRTDTEQWWPAGCLVQWRRLPSQRERYLFLEPVRWLGQSHRIAHQLSPNVNPLDTAKGQNKHWAEFTLRQKRRWMHCAEITLCQHRRGKALGRNHIVSIPTQKKALGRNHNVSTP